MTTPSIFISYRREDAAGDTGRLADHLHRRFGAARVFLDIDTIQPGSDFLSVLQASLQQTAVALVVIGPRWTSVRDASGNRRLDDPNDLVRIEIETALKRGIPVVPVLVQGAGLPKAGELPASLAPLISRQAVTIDHAEFHPDVERLCNQLAPLVEAGNAARWLRRHRTAVAVAVLAAAMAAAAYGWLRTRSDNAGGGDAAGRSALSRARAAEVDALLAEAAVQRRRNAFDDALATLARARDVAPASDDVREAQEELAMDWLRNIRVESGRSTFTEAIQPALAVIDAALPTATGTRRADLLAHSGWATFLLWREGNRQLDPAEWYREALSLDPGNPYANAMLAHWLLFQQDEDLPKASSLFETALASRRATEAVRALQWAAYGNAAAPEADAERVRIANAMRREGQRLTAEQTSALWSRYARAMPPGADRQRELLLAALPPDEHISTLQWAFEAYASNDPYRARTLRYYVARLHAAAGRVDEAVAALESLDSELAGSPGSMQDAVQEALRAAQRRR